MPTKVRSCELDTTYPSEECFHEMCAFLESFQITASGAQMILEVATCRQHHIDFNTLAKRMPEEFQKVDTGTLVKELINARFLEPYQSKKEVFCVRCSALGRDVAYLIRERCYSNKLKHFDVLAKKYSDQGYLLCFDPQGFKVSEKRYARGPNGKRITILVTKKSRADSVFRQAENGVPLYDIRLEAEILGCPKCDKKIQFEYSYNPSSCYKEFVPIQCKNCGFKFMLRHALDKFY